MWRLILCTGHAIIKQSGEYPINLSCDSFKGKSGFNVETFRIFYCSAPHEPRFKSMCTARVCKSFMYGYQLIRSIGSEKWSTKSAHRPVSLLCQIQRDFSMAHNPNQPNSQEPPPASLSVALPGLSCHY